jgi:hypothetical protein
VAITIAIHAVGIVVIVNVLEKIWHNIRVRTYRYSGPQTIALIVAVALSLALLHAIESMTWAMVYVWLGAVASPADAALYSVDSMTTRGSSGLILERQWRMMGATEAGDGMLLFGTSTAFLFYVMLRLWKIDEQNTG